MRKKIGDVKVGGLNDKLPKDYRFWFHRDRCKLITFLTYCAIGLITASSILRSFLVSGVYKYVPVNTFIITLVLLAHIHSSIAGEVTCQAGTVESGSPASVECLFDRDLNRTKHSFIMERRTPNQTSKYPGTVALCIWEGKDQDSDLRCAVAKGFSFSGRVSDRLSVDIPAASPYFEGLYICRLQPEEGSTSASCNLTVREAKPKTTTEIVLTTTDDPKDDNEQMTKQLGELQAKTSVLIVFVVFQLLLTIVILIYLIFRMVSQHIGKPFALHHIDRALHRMVIPDGWLIAYAQSLRAREVLKCVKCFTRNMLPCTAWKGREEVPVPQLDPVA